MTGYHSKEHDILKLCDRYKGKKIHYCPDCIDDKVLFEKIKRVSGFRALKHHCVFRWATDKHCCKFDESITKEDLFIAIADVKASVISRKSNIGYRKGRKTQSIWNTYHIWVNKEIDECVGNLPHDATVLEEIETSQNISAVFSKRSSQIRQRSEDAWQCPFASLMTHSELTERWFNFFNKNNAYFNVPEVINSVSEAREISSGIDQSEKNYKKGLSICFMRLKLFANQSLSRIADAEIPRETKP